MLKLAKQPCCLNRNFFLGDSLESISQALMPVQASIKLQLIPVEGFHPLCCNYFFHPAVGDWGPRKKAGMKVIDLSESMGLCIDLLEGSTQGHLLDWPLLPQDESLL